MYEYKDNDIVSLSVNFRDLVPSSEDITQDELRLTTSDAQVELTEDQLDGLKKRFKKIQYTILDGDQNRKGFGVTPEGMQVFVDHFNATKEDKDLHNFFKDHDYGKIDSMLGRIVDTRYDKKNNRVRRTALIDLRHPTAQRLDMFQNLSTTLLHGKPVCSECGQEYMTCIHTDAFPQSTVAYGIEDSLVTQSAYPNAKRDSLGMFQDSLSSIDISKDFFKEEVKEDQLAIKEELKKKLDEQKAEEEIAKSVLKQQKLDAEIEKELKSIKENIESLKDIVEKSTGIY